MNFEIEIDGKKMFAKTGDLAQQSNGSCLFGIGDTVVLATATMGKEKTDLDYFPLSIDYEERFYAAGKIKGSRFIKRETRPPDEAILTGRAIDRGIRPLFDDRLRYPVQVIITVLAIDKENDPDLVALYAASLALGISDIPWSGPISGVRVARANNQFIADPTFEQRSASDLDLMFSARQGRVLMLETSANQIDEKTVEDGIVFGLKFSAQVENFLQDIIKKIGKEKVKITDDSSSTIEDASANEIVDQAIDATIFSKPLVNKKDRVSAKSKIAEEVEAKLIEKNIGKDKREKILDSIENKIYRKVGQAILDKDYRIDGRKLDEIRTLKGDVGILPRVHGSAVFSRGETQVLSVITLGAPEMEQYLDTMEESGRKRFMHHYNFPPYSTGETGGMRSTGRREIGHGYLVEKALRGILPPQDNFPYTIRIVSEVLSSNGSSSMASTCASCLALMDAGIPITAPAAGIAIGLASEEDDKNILRYKIFTDLQDLEDGPGGMDFKTIGTEKGILAIQMDTKTRGITLPIIKDALKAALAGRLQILSFNKTILALPRTNLSEYAPRIEMLDIDPKKIKDLIGPGGRNINEIIAKTDAEIEVQQTGRVTITASDQKKLNAAIDLVKALTQELEVGDVFQAKITRILDFGAFAEVAPGREGLIHVSELADTYVKNPNDVVKIGDSIKVQVISIDNMGRINFSAKKVNPVK